jgi:type II secretory pathway pseudopilin PulG
MMAGTNRTRSPHGFTILEIAVAAGMLAALLGVIAQTLVVVERSSRRTERRAVAMRALENLLEEATVGAWDDVDEGRIDALQLPDDLRRRWPAAQLTSEVVESLGPVAAKRVTLRLQMSPTERELPVTFTTWIFKAPEG